MLGGRYVLIPLAVCALLPVAAGGVSAAPQPRVECADNRPEYRADRLPPAVPPNVCDLRGKIIRNDGAAVVVPPVGRFVQAHVDIVDSTNPEAGGQSLLVTTLGDGTVVIEEDGDQAEAGAQTPPGGPAGGGDECRTNYYVDLQFRETGEINWWFRSRTTPAGLDIHSVAVDMTNGYNNWATMRNACGWPDNSSARNRYNGDRDLPTRINSDGVCTAADAVSMVDFGVLPLDKYVAVNCTYGTSDGEADESDIKLSNQYRWFTGLIRAGCGDLLSVEALMTHESGHTYGLGDVSGSDLMTMFHRSFYCSRIHVSLAQGDVTLVERKY